MVFIVLLPFFKPLSKVSRLIKNMDKAISVNQLDWSLCELSAYGTLLLEGFNVRLSGQDSERGTFSQRHSVLYSQENEDRFIPLNHLSDDQARFEIDPAGEPVPMTLSVGIAGLLPDELPSELLRRADGALYEAKKDGRDRIIFAEEVGAHDLG